MATFHPQTQGALYFLKSEFLPSLNIYQYESLQKKPEYPIWWVRTGFPGDISKNLKHDGVSKRPSHYGKRLSDDRLAYSRS
jgi:hypothetical protein